MQISGNIGFILPVSSCLKSSCCKKYTTIDAIIYDIVWDLFTYLLSFNEGGGRGRAITELFLKSLLNNFSFLKNGKFWCNLNEIEHAHLFVRYKTV